MELTDVQIHETHDGVHLTLPRRDAGPLRRVALIPMLLGGVMVAIPLAVIANSLLAPSATAPFTFDLIHSLFFLPLAFIGYQIFFIGAAVRHGHSEVRIAAGKLVSIERIGPLRKRWSRPADQIARFVVRGGMPDDAGPWRRWTPAAGLYGIRVESHQGSAMGAAIGYPHAIVTHVAKELARICQAHQLSAPDIQHRSGHMDDLRREQRLQQARFTARTDDAPAPPLVVDALTDDDAPWPQPADSTAVIDQRAQGLTLTLPPRGLRKGSGGIFAFSVIWLAIVGLFMAISITVGFTGRADPTAIIVIPLFLLVFLAIGVAMLLTAIRMGRRTVILDIVGDPGHTLLVTQQSPFGIKQHEYPRDHIAAVRAGPSGTTVNNQPLMQLQIVLNANAGRRKIGLLTALPEDELQWIAQQVRHALRLRSSS